MPLVTTPVPIDEPLSRNVTVPPDGVPVNCGATVAVNVTLWPNTGDEDDEPVTVVVVPARLTVWLKATEVLAVKLASLTAS